MAEKRRQIICTFSRRYRYLNKYFLIYDARMKRFLCLSSTTCLVLFEKYKEKHVVRYPNAVMDVCLESAEDKLTWWTLTEDSVWHSIIPSSSCDEAENMDTEADLFDDFLQDEVFQTHGPSIVNSDLGCEPGCRVVSGVTGGKRIAVCGSVLVILIQKECEWWLSFYSIQDSGNGFKVQKQRDVYAMDSFTSVDSLADLKTVQQYLPELYIVMSSGSTTNMQVFNNKTALVSLQLFTELFGSELSLTGTPVCVVTSHRGGVYSVPLLLRQSLLSNTVMDVDDPVIAMYTLSVSLKIVQGEHKLCVVDMKTVLPESKPANCILMVGRHGQVHVLLIVTKEASSKTVNHKFSIPGTVQCADIYGSLLIHSNGQDVFITDLAPLFCKILENPSDNSLNMPLQNQLQGVSNVKKICFEACESPSIGSEANVPYIALTSKGMLLSLTASRDTKLKFSGQLPSANGIKDVLKEIGRVSEHLDGVQAKVKHQDTILNQLHIASLIMSTVPKLKSTNQKNCKNLRNLVLFDKNCPVSVSWRVEIVETRSGIMSYTFVLRLLTVGVHLGSDWCLSVSLKEGSTCPRRRLAICSKVTYIGKLSPGEFSDIRIDLDEVLHGEECLPLTVSSELLYDVKDISTKGITHEGCHVCIPLPPVVLDIFHFLTPSVGGSEQNSPGKNEPGKHLENMAKSRSCYQSHVLRKLSDSDYRIPGSCTSSITLKREQMKILGVNSELDVMKWLYKETDHGINDTIVRSLSLHKYQVTISIQSSEDSSYQTVIQTQNMGLLLQVERSIHNKLKLVSDETPALTLAEAGNLLGRIQLLLGDVICLQDNRAARSKEDIVSNILTVHQKLKDIRI